MNNKTNLEIFTGAKDFTNEELKGLFSENEAIIFAKLLRDCVYGHNKSKSIKSLILFWLQKECYEVGRIDNSFNSNDEYKEELGEIISKIHKLSVLQCYVVLDVVKEYWHESDDKASFLILSKLTNKNQMNLTAEHEKKNDVKRAYTISTKGIVPKYTNAGKNARSGFNINSMLKTSREVLASYEMEKLEAKYKIKSIKAKYKV